MRKLVLLSCVLLSSLFIVKSACAQNLERSIGYLMFSDQDHGEGLSKLEITVFDEPDGEKTGYIKFTRDDKPEDESDYTYPYFFDESGERNADKVSEENLACYERFLSVYNFKDGWALTSAGWVKTKTTLSFEVWRDHYRYDDTSLGAFPYKIKDPQMLLGAPSETDYTDQKGLYAMDSEAMISTEGRFLHILKTEGDFALVVLTDKEGFYCAHPPIALEGQLGWIRYVSLEGYSLIHQVYGCC